jgi:putative ABC transport system permease protein
MTGWASGETEISISTPDGVLNQPTQTRYVSADFFRTLGVKLVSGAGFDASVDDPLQVQPVVVLGYDGPPRSGPDLGMLGKTLTVNGTPHVVVGIAPDDFTDQIGVQLFLPLALHPLLQAKNSRLNRADEWIYIDGRLSPGTGVERAKAVLNAVTTRLAEQYAATNEFKVGRSSHTTASPMPSVRNRCSFNRSCSP